MASKSTSTPAKKTTTRKAPAKKAATAKSTAAKKTVEAKRAAQEPNDQHPALDGDQGVEVAKRSQDVESLDTLTHRKDFVVLAREYGSNDKDEMHRNNVEATRQYLISQGLRPTGDGKFAGAEDHPDGLSIILHYDVPVVPAVTALADTGEQTVTHAHVTLDDQHAAEAAADE